MRWVHRVMTGAAFAGTAAFMAHGVKAQSLVVKDLPDTRIDLPFETVLSRAHPDFDPIGYQAGPWRLNAGVDLRTAYDSNPAALPTGGKDDGVIEVAPAAELTGNWGDHGVRVSVDSALGFYLDDTQQDYRNVDSSLYGYIQTAENQQLNAQFRYRRMRQPRDDPDDDLLARTPVYSIPEATLSYTSDVGRLRYRVQGRYTWMRVGDSQFGNGLTRSNADRDRNVATLGATVSYGKGDWPRFYVSTLVARNAYVLPVDRSGFDRDGWQVTALAGVQLPLGPLVALDAAAGVSHYSFSSNALPDRSKMAFRANLAWSATPLLTVNLRAERMTGPTSLIGAQLLTRTDYRVGADYELLRNLLVHAEFGGSRRSYTGLTRRDTVIQGELTFRYMFNNAVGLEAGYNFRSRSVNRVPGNPDLDFNRHRMFLGLSWQL